MTNPFIWLSSERGLICLGVSIVHIFGRTVTIIPAQVLLIEQNKTGFYVSAADASNMGHDRNKSVAVDYLQLPRI